MIKKKLLSESVKSETVRDSLGFGNHMYNKGRATFTNLNEATYCGIWQLYNIINVSNKPSDELLYGTLVVYASMGFVVQIVYHHLDNRAWRRHKSDNTDWGMWKLIQ